MPASNGLKVYRNLQELLSDVYSTQIAKEKEHVFDIAEREARDEKGQIASSRTFSAWNKGSSQPRSGKLERLSNATRVPEEVLILLTSGYTVPYDHSARKFSFFHFNTGPLSERRLRELPYVDSGRFPDISKRLICEDPKGMLEEIEKHYDFPEHKKLRENRKLEIFQKASLALPGLNFLVYNSKGRYCGHIITYPLVAKSLTKMMDDTLREGSLRISDIANTYKYPVHVSLHLYSVYVSHSAYNYFIINEIRKWVYLNRQELYLRIYISMCPLSEDEKQLCEVFHLSPVEKEVHKISPTTVYKNHLKTIRERLHWP